MSLAFKELDFQQTALGDISLRRRAEPRLNGKVLYEVKLGDEFLMSSLFTEAEVQLATLGLAKIDANEIDVIVGGLGLGYTAAAVLEDPRLRSLAVIELMPPVIDWHQRGLVPLGEQLSGDPRCSFILNDFFALASHASNHFRDVNSNRRVHAVLLDIDHSPDHWLDSQNSKFYTQAGLEHLALKLLPGGVFGLWSNDPPDDRFMHLLEDVFQQVEHHIISFENPYTMGKSTNTVYLARSD